MLIGTLMTTLRSTASDLAPPSVPSPCRMARTVQGLVLMLSGVDAVSRGRTDDHPAAEIMSSRQSLKRMKGERVFATLDPRLSSPGKLRPDRG
jgi:hypothetical protein